MSLEPIFANLPMISQVFAEAALGNTVDNSGRHGFLKYGTSVLRFYSYWDDSSSLYGDVLMFKLHYFLYDNTIEILTVLSYSVEQSYPVSTFRASGALTKFRPR